MKKKKVNVCGKVEKQKKKPGGQPGNKNAEKWTEVEAIKLADELIDWMCPKLEKDEKTGKIVDLHAANIWKLDFLSIVKRLPKDEINVLARKFPSFAKKAELADNIQEAKILKYGSAGKLNPAVSIFTLKVLHGHNEKMEVSGNISNIPIYDYSKCSTEELRAMQAILKKAEK